MDDITFRWTDGTDRDFLMFYLETEKYYNSIVGGSANRSGFIPYNLSDSIPIVLIAVCDGKAVGCAALKPYSDYDAEIKRVWVAPDYRGKHIASKMMHMIEEKARETGYKRTILQTRPIMTDAVRLYESRGYSGIGNYPPYDKLNGAICMALEL
ncbi:MAG: GNAT family N-acetyltransferase [Eubacteriales bacterium]|jgi:ribosomal protein S18 acetylase RimI-like enzyme